MSTILTPYSYIDSATVFYLHCFSAGPDHSVQWYKVFLDALRPLKILFLCLRACGIKYGLIARCCLYCTARRHKRLFKTLFFLGYRPQMFGHYCCALGDVSFTSGFREHSRPPQGLRSWTPWILGIAFVPKFRFGLYLCITCARGPFGIHLELGLSLFSYWMELWSVDTLVGRVRLTSFELSGRVLCFGPDFAFCPCS